MAFGFRWLIHGEAVLSRHDERCLPMATDEWEIEDYTRIPYPEAWDRDPGDSDTAADAAGPADDDGADDDGFGREVTHAANAWFRAVELLVNQGFDPEDCEAEVMRRCVKVSRRQRMIRRIQQEEAVYGRLTADESVCSLNRRLIRRDVSSLDRAACATSIRRMNRSSGSARSRSSCAENALNPRSPSSINASKSCG